MRTTTKVAGFVASFVLAWPAAAQNLYPTLPTLSGGEMVQFAYVPGTNLGPFYADLNQLSTFFGGSGSGGTPSGAVGDLQTKAGPTTFGHITPGSGVATFLATPTAHVLGAWLESGAAVANLGFTPADSARTVTGTGMLAGGGDLTTNRTLNIAAIAANSLLMNATGGLAVPTAVAVPDCADTGGQHLNYSGVFSCGTSGGIGSWDATDGTNTVTGVSLVTFDPKSMVVGGSAGAATVSQTSTIGTDRSTGDYTFDPTDSNTTIPVGVHTYTISQAGSAGFEAGWGTCIQNIAASGNATVISATTSVFKGAGGTTSFVLDAGGWACFASKGGDWYTQVGHFNTLPGAVYLSGTLTPSALSGNVNDYNPPGLSGASVLRIDGGAADRNITGVSGGVEGQILTVINIGSTNSLTFVNNSGSSSAGNKFLLPADTGIAPNSSLTFRYDATSPGYWRPLTRPLSNTGVVVGAYTCMNGTVAADGRLTAAANGSCGSGTAIALPAAGWIATSKVDGAIVFTATRTMTVSAIRGSVHTPVGATAAVTVKKAASGTSCTSSGTALHTGSFNANGTAETSQTLTLVGGATDDLAAGDQICLSSPNDAAFAAGVGIGTITVEVTM